jgi:HAD superfamily hydrolase (TIGR01509 family)
MTSKSGGTHAALPSAIVFDFGGVICSFDIALFLRRVRPYSEISTAQMEKAFLSEVSTQARLYETGLITSEVFYRRITGMGQISMPMEELAIAYASIFTPIPETIALIKNLKGRYPLGLLSNTSEWHFEYGIKLTEVFPLFDAVVLSYQVKAMKPVRLMYDTMLLKLAVPAGEVVYIDDLPENVEAAAALGMKTIHYASPAALLGEIKAYGVKVDAATRT